jgi:hypothetical protein
MSDNEDFSDSDSYVQDGLDDNYCYYDSGSDDYEFGHDDNESSDGLSE